VGVLSDAASGGASGGVSLRRYLVATDLSPAAHDAAAFAARLARRTGAAVHLTSVLPPEGDASHGDFVRVSEQLEAAVEAMRADGVRAGFTVVRGADLPRALLAEAARVQAGTVVVGDAVTSREDRVAPSGVTERLLRDAPGRVLVVRPGRAELPRELVVAVGLCQAAAGFLGPVLEYAQELGLPVRLLHAVHPPDMWEQARAPADPERLVRVRGEFEELLARLPHGARVQVEVVESDPVRALEAATRRHGGVMVVAATHTKPLIQELLVGSVARTVATRVDAHVLLVRATHERVPSELPAG
jgi:nucleotide-binding universal stress UspA family protein